MKATIGLGSNMGDRFAYLQQALDSLNTVMKLIRSGDLNKRII